MTALAQDSQALALILEGIADGITVQDRAGHVVFANSAAARQSGYSSVEAFVGAKPGEQVSRFEIFDQDGAPFDVRNLPGRRVLRGEPDCSAVINARDRFSGRQLWSLVRASSVPGPDGMPNFAINIWHDVTEVHRRERHEAYLAQATAALSDSLDYPRMLSTLAGLLVPGIADWCVVHLRAGDDLEVVTVVHVDPLKVEAAREVNRKYPPHRSHPSGVWNVLRTGVSEIFADIPDELLVSVSKDAAHLSILRETGMKSVMIVPIRIRDAVTGTITLVSSEGLRRYDRHDLTLAEELGRRAGASIENARLYAAEKKARDQLALLADAGEAFASAKSVEATLQCVMDIALPALGDFGFLQMTEEFAASRTIARAYADDALSAALQKVHVPATLGFFPAIDVTQNAQLPFGAGNGPWLEHSQLCSMVSVAISADGEACGVLSLCFGKSKRRHSAADEKLIAELARRAGLALAQSRLYARAQLAALRAQEAAERAEEANRAKDEFLATVSHELRTPLNAILGWASLLRERGHEAVSDKAVEVIHRNAVAQSKIIDDILDVARIITGKLHLDAKSMDLALVVEDAIEVIRPSAAAKGISVEFAPHAGRSVLIADSQRLQQVAWNLLSNAVKFTAAGGAIRIDLSAGVDSLVLTVSDTGRGIDAAFLPFVFDRFKQADGSMTRRVGGLGLGLAIVRHIVELHGGTVSVHSAGLERGSRFTVTLPVRVAVPGPSTTERERNVQSEATGGQGVLAGVRVLVVDDDNDARDLLEVVLLGAGAVVETAPSAERGFVALTRFLPHVLISDIAMPEEDGYLFMTRVRSLPTAAGGGIPSIALTAYTSERDKTRALAMGYSSHLGKPLHPPDLIACVANLAALVTGRGC